MAALRSSPTESAAGPTLSRLWLGFALVALALIAAAFVASSEIGGARAIAAARARAADAGTLAIAVLRGELEKQRALPVILSRDRDVETALRGGDRLMLDGKLEEIARETRTAVIYLLDLEGRAIAASNWREPTSFVGSDYAFRDYFTGAMAKGQAEQFALGTVSNRPGLYITRRIDRDGAPLGVIVVKVEFDRVEADWRALGGETYVMDARGVVLFATTPGWQFNLRAPLPPAEVDDIRRSLQFGTAPLPLLPLAAEGELTRRTDDRNSLHVSRLVPVPTTNWRLDILLPVDRAMRSERNALRTLAALVLMPGIGLAAYLLTRRERLAAGRREQARINRELERRVAERTSELASSNARLVEEIAQRAQAQEKLSDAREELAKANRLATLGQVAAGVAHEVNQPLAAIRTYTENARTLLARKDVAAVEGAMGKVIALTERISAITDSLRGFARRGGGVLEPVAVDEAIAGALMILDAPSRHAGLVPLIVPARSDLRVLAGRIELEQVLVNLLRNAVEALAAGANPGGPPLAISVAEQAGEVTITVADRGPGLDEAALAALFTPFRTTKPRGLGLGLVISHDIVASFGGTLVASARPGEGCVFTITLARA